MSSNFATTAAFIITTVLVCPTLVVSKGFLVERKGSLRANLDPTAFQGDIRNAVNEALGCGRHLTPEHMSAIEKVLLPMWRSLPKSGSGRIDRRSLRYLAHRYFNQQFSLVIRGFEPSRPTNSTSWGTADILSQGVPAYVESVLESKHATDIGFDLHDAVYMVATLEHLIFDSESTLLEKVYKSQSKPLRRSLTQQGLQQVLEEYMVHWMMNADAEGIQLLLKNRTLLQTAFPHWDQLLLFTRGQIRAIQYQRERNPQQWSRPQHNALAERYSFDDAHDVVGGITRSFASFWESECASMKMSLVDMDTHNTGRVPLSRFYSSALESEWRFGESESYLRELGALDETSTWRGKQVIIPNYIQAASNCIVAMPHYSVCCANECEGLLADIEVATGGPTAAPGELLRLVGNMTSQTTVNHDDPPNLQGSLTEQLEQIAAAHGGKVPLHGRLFAQWLHYAFPRECPFPHKTGTVNPATPSEFGDSYIATEEEMKRHSETASTSNIPATMAKEELQWMSQWSSEEELIAEHAGELRAPWERHCYAVGGALVFAIAGLVGVIGAKSNVAGSSSPSLLPTHTKAHFV